MRKQFPERNAHPVHGTRKSPQLDKPDLSPDKPSLSHSDKPSLSKINPLYHQLNSVYLKKSLFMQINPVYLR